MATLLNWLEDPLKKKLDSKRQFGVSNVLPKQNTGLISGTKTVVTQNQLRPSIIQNNAQNFQPSATPKAPFKVSNTFSSSSVSQKSPISQLNLQSRNNPPKLNTLNSSKNTLTTLNKDVFKPALDLRTATNKVAPTQQNNDTADPTLDRAAQAKERYDTLRDNNNEYWNKYKSALETTKDQYKNLFGESIQQRSASQLGSGLKKLTNEQGSLPNSGEEFVTKYRSLSNDDKWDVWQNLQKAKTSLTQAISKADDEGQEELRNAFGTLLSEVNLYDDIIAGEDRGKKSLGKSFGDWITSGGIVGSMAEPATNALGTISEIMGNKGGAETARAISQNNANQNYGNNKVFDAVNFTGSTVGNIAGNMVTGGAYGLVNAGLGLADSASSAITDRNRNYYTDNEGNLIRENQSTASKLAGAGNAALSAGLTAAGMKGFGPNINFKDGQTLQSLLANKNFGEIGKAMGRYAAKEVPFALATTAASQGISALGGDKNFTDDFGAELANNIVGDLAVDLTGAVRQGRGGTRDLFKSGHESDPSALQTLAKLGHRINDGSNEIIRKSTSKIDDGYTAMVNKGAVNRLAKGIEQGADGNIRFVRMGKDIFNDINNVRVAQKLEPLTKRQVTAYQNAVNNNLNNRVNEGMTPQRVAQIAYNSLTSFESEALPGRHKNTVVVAPYVKDKYDGSVLGKAQDGGTSLKSIEPRSKKFVNDEQSMKKDLLKGQLGSPLTANQEGGVTQPGATDPVSSRTSLGSRHPESSATPSGVLESNIPQRAQNVNGRSTLDTITGEKWIDKSAKSKVEEIDLNQYVKSQVATQKAETKTPIKQKAQDTLDNLKHYLVDDAVAYERYVKDKGERMNLREGVDRVRTSDTIAKQMIEDSGLAETIGRMKSANADEFQQYLIAKRSQELKRTKGADFKTGRNDAADRALIQAVGDKYATQEKVVRNFNKQMLDYAVDTGLISRSLRDQLIRDNTDYVPMNRVLDDINGMEMHKSKQLGNLSKQTAVQKIEGSDRVVQNPLESMIRNAIRTVNEGERNQVAKQLSETTAFREARLPDGAKPKAGNDAISFIVNGEKVRYEVPALVAKEMKNLNGVMPDFMQGIIKVMGAPTKVLRTGATGANPMFAISNLVRDQLQTTITGSIKANIKGTPDALLATFGIGKKGKAMQAELARQGIIGSEYRQTYGYKSGELVKELQQSHQLPKQAWERLKHPIDTLADVIGKTEYFTRAQQYYGTKGTVVEKSQAARNNTLNFGRAGATVRVLNKIIPFLNAGVQGGRITVNQFKERPVRTTMAVAAFAGVAAAVQGVNRTKDEELWNRIGDEEKQSNLIIFGDNARYDPETNRVVGVTKVPLPQMVYPITDAVNNLKGRPEDMMMLGGDIFTAITGIDSSNPMNQLTPTAAKPFLETLFNKNSYTGQEIVSEYDKNLDPEDKGKKYTTGLARTVAKATGIDAPVIDNFIQNWGGGLFKDLTKVMTDNPDNKSDGGGIGEIFSQGAFRRFMSASIESQYDIQSTLAEDYKKQLKADPTFQSMSAEDQKSALDNIDNDTKAIAGYAAKAEQGRSAEITHDLSKRQKKLMQDGFSVDNYNRPSKKSGGHNLEINDTIKSEHKQTLEQYNSMEKEDWEKYLYSAEGRDAEYRLASAKYENDKANGDLTEVEDLRRKKELRKLKVSQMWNKDVRDAYSLAGSRTDMQGLLNELDNRADMVGYLNALNRAMYDAGVITASTYKSRNRNINNLESSKGHRGKKGKRSVYSAASKAALSAYTKALSSGNGIKVGSGARVPSTTHRMSTVALATSIKKASLGAQAKVSVKKGIK